MLLLLISKRSTMNGSWNDVIYKFFFLNLVNYRPIFYQILISSYKMLSKINTFNGVSIFTFLANIFDFTLKKTIEVFSVNFWNYPMQVYKTMNYKNYK